MGLVWNVCKDSGGTNSVTKVLDNDDLGLREAQEKIFKLDGKNSYRAADFISSII